MQPITLSEKHRNMYQDAKVYWAGEVRKVSRKGKKQDRVLLATSTMLILCDEDVIKRIVRYDQVQQGHVLDNGEEGAEVLLDIDGESSLHWVSAPNTFISDQSPWRVLDVVSSLRAKFLEGNGLPIIRESSTAQLLSNKRILPKGELHLMPITPRRAAPSETPIPFIRPVYSISGEMPLPLLALV